jgi:hypothetical protein
MPTRDNKRIIRINDDEMYDEIFEERDVKQIRQYMTAEIGYPTTAQKLSLNSVNHIWKLGDRFYKLSYEHYGDSRFWWVIAWYNMKPTEAHVKIGDVLAIPFPLERAMRYYNKE